MVLRSTLAGAPRRVCLSGDDLRIDDVVAVARRGAPLELTTDPRVLGGVEASRAFIARAVAEGEPIYGVTTGFGGMAHVAIPREQAAELQTNMLWYHKTGAGRRLSTADVRASMVLRANTLLRGVSGVRIELIQRLVDFVNAGATPHVHELGSIGASGDLVPLGYIAGCITGLDPCFRIDLGGEELGAPQALERLGLQPIALQPKEALALMNGTSVMAGVAAGCVHDAARIVAIALHAHAMFVQALRGTNQSFHPFIHGHKPHPGQVWAAAHMLDLLAGSQLVRDQMYGRHQHRGHELIQDRYSLRCLPQFLGPIVDGLLSIRGQVEVELNSATDNPLIDGKNHAAYHGGNFLGQYIGVGMDQLRYHLGLVAKHLDVQLALLVAPEFNGGLPGSLVGNPERRVNMGLKGLQLSGNSIMPLLGFYGNSLVDRFPTHAEQFNQNINSQGFGSANLARQSIDLMHQYLAICLLFGVQAVDLRTFQQAGHYDAPRLLSAATARTYLAIREVTGHAPSADRPYVWDDDQRPLDEDIRRIADDIARGGLIPASVEETVTSLVERGSSPAKSRSGVGARTAGHGERLVNIALHVEQGAKQFPERAAVVFEGRTLTYRAIDEIANRTANALQRLGIRRGDRVALLLPNTPDFVTTYLGIQKLGAIAVSIATALLQGEVGFILEDSGARAVVTTAELGVNVPGDGLPALLHRLVVDAPAGDPASFPRLLEAESPEAAAVEMRWNEPACIVYSSGTTGFPKGATLSHGNLLSNVRSKQRLLDIRAEDRLLLFVPLYHCFGQNAVMNSALHAGATIVLLRQFQPRPVMKALADDGVTMFFGIPTTYVILHDRLSVAELGSVRYFFSAAGPLPVEVERRWLEKFGVPIHQGYGLTETSPFASYNHHLKYKPGSIGTPIDDVEMKVVDVEDGRDREPGAQGEILIRGPNVMLGYWNRPVETAEIMTGDWLHTGDIGKMDYEGYFYLLDRLKDMVNVGGLKVYPAEVENILLRHPAVAEVAVYGVPDPILGERVRADVVLRPGCAAPGEELIVFCRRQIANFKVPNLVTFVDELPRSRTGKVLKRVLRERAER